MALPASGQSSISQADRKDTGDVAAFIENALLLHRNLDWRSTIQWIDRSPFLLKKENNKIVGLLSCAPDPEGIAWIHCFAANDLNRYREIWQEMLNVAKSTPTLQKCMLCSVGLIPWFNELLELSGFSVLQQIVVLYWNGKIPSPASLSSEIIIRPMESEDLEQVIQVDHTAFAPIWQISEESFKQVYLQAEHASVAEIDGKIIGYELSTANHFSAHLTRLAVLPAYTKSHIGYSLAREMLVYFHKRGIRQISVNTHCDNLASLSLYKKSGFELSEENYPVYCLQL